VKVAQQGEVMGERLAEAEARIADHRLQRQAILFRPGEEFSEEIGNLCGRVDVDGRRLHGRGPVERVHEHVACVLLGDDRPEFRVPAARADVVDDFGSLFKDSLGDRALPRIDGEGNLEAALQAAHDGKNAGQLDFRTDRRGTGPGRLASNIEEVGALGLQFQRAIECGLGIEVDAAIGKRIGRDVEDAHDERPLVPLQCARLQFPGMGRHPFKLPPSRRLG
jgi:hypothetical protein